MNYTSTRGTVAVNETYALLHGLAEDGGLYVPSLFPTNCLTYNDVKDKNYQEVAAVVLSKLFPCFSEAHLNEMINSAYSDANFSTRDIAPLHSLLEKVSVLELFHGRTQAFKDMALSLFPYLLVAAKEAEGEKKEVLILTATSGDTGKAALEGFKDVPGTHIQVFYPTDGVSPMQAEQMQKQEGENVNVTAIHGNFDDAQSGVKKIFTDVDYKNLLDRNQFKLSSANSINWGRLVPQIVYYFSSYAELVKNNEIEIGDKINVVVPTGNFGNILAAYYAKKMGLPIAKFICASNENNVLTDFIKTGVYNKNRDFHTTISPSMDILISSNLERFLYDLTGCDDKLVSEWMKELNTNGSYEVSADVKAKMQEMFTAGCCDDAETMATIKKCASEYDYVIDTHTAVAKSVYDKYVAQTGDTTKTIIASTASPFKFNQSVLIALEDHNAVVGKDEFTLLKELSEKSNMQIPKSLYELKDKSVVFDLVCDKDEMQQIVSDFLMVE